MIHILLSSGAIDKGNTVLKILYVFILAIALSTCTLIDAIFLVVASSFTLKQLLFLRKGGIFSLTPWG